MRRSIAATLLAAGLGAPPAVADEIVALETRPGVRQPVLLLEPRGPAQGVVVLLPGHDGEVEFRKADDGAYEVDNRGGGLTAHRAMRETLRRNRFAVAVLAPPSDQVHLSASFRKSPEHLQDLRAVIAHLSARYGTKPFLHGHCLATLSAAAAASSLGQEAIAGLVLSSTRTSGAAGAVTDFRRGAVNVPVLLVHHRDDSCPDSPYSEVDRLRAYYRESAPRVDLVTVAGGKAKLRRKVQSCQDGFHGFRGKQRETAQAIADWLQGREFPGIVPE